MQKSCICYTLRGELLTVVDRFARPKPSIMSSLKHLDQRADSRLDDFCMDFRSFMALVGTNELTLLFTALFSTRAVPMRFYVGRTQRQVFHIRS